MSKLDSIPANCEFPQLHEILDAQHRLQTVRRHLQPFFKHGGPAIENCTIDQIHYKTNANCRVVLSVSLRHPNNEVGSQIYFGKLFYSQDAQQVFAAIDCQGLTQPDVGPAVLVIPEWGAVLWAYPNDPEVPGLPLMLNADKVRKMIAATPKAFGLDRPPAPLQGQMTKYVAGKRCGFIYRTAPEGGEADGAWAIFGKAYGDNRGENAFALMKQIWDSEACQQGAFAIPRPYRYDAPTQIVWQEAIVGECVESHPDIPAVATQIGARLAAFHGTPLQLPQEMTLDFQIEKVREAVAAINRAFPDFARPCSSVGKKLLDAAQRLGPGPLTPVHASFKPTHILAAKKGIVFIDFDGANIGDPGYDLGRFLAHIYRTKAGKKMSAEVADHTIINFCTSYNRAARSPVSQDRVEWFAASHLVISELYKSVKRMKTSLVSRLLDVADHLCPG